MCLFNDLLQDPSVFSNNNSWFFCFYDNFSEAWVKVYVRDLGFCGDNLFYDSFCISFFSSYRRVGTHNYPLSDQLNYICNYVTLLN